MTERRAHREPLLRRAVGGSLGAWYVAVVIFLFAPIVTSIVYSFNVGTLGKQTALFTGWTTTWYPAAWDNLSLRGSVETSLSVAAWAAALALVLGAALGYALVRHPAARVRSVLSTLTYLLLIVPETVMGISLLLFYAETKIALGEATLVAGLTPIDMAVTALIVRSRVLTLDRRLEDAAADLGGNRWQTLWFVVLPQVLPALATSALLSFTFSFDNVVVSSFLTTASVSTLPVYLYGSLQYGPAPSVYAATTAVFVFTAIPLALAGAVYGLARRRQPRWSPAASRMAPRASVQAWARR